MTREPPVCDCPSYTALEGRNVVLRAELARLKHDLHHYDALQTAFHNVNKLVEEQEAEIERLKAALQKISRVPDQRHTSGHLDSCAWCNGSAEIARAALEDIANSYNTPLRAEVERLRAFAQWVADHSNDPHVVARAKFWSRPALEPKP